MIRIKRLEMLSNYKKLRAGTIFEFGDSNILAIAGVNGSGKTQLLEVLSSILINLRDNNNTQWLEFDYNLEIEKGDNHSLDIFIITQNSNRGLLNKCQNFIVRPNFTDDSRFDIFFGNSLYVSLCNIDLNFNVITYSSVKRTPLSSQIDLFTLNYLNIYRDNIVYSGINFHKSLDYVHINEKLSKLIILTLFIFHREELRNLLGNIISVNEISSFKLYYNPPLYRKLNTYNMYENFEILLYNELWMSKNILGIISGFYACDHLYINQIRNNFSNSSAFYLTLQAMENFNILGIPDNIRKNLNKENLSEKLENIYSNNNFYIEDIVFNDDISYKNLADGEKQLLSTIGMMLIYQKSISNKKDNIFIFDEPGTHLNPAWKINYVSYLEKILNIENNDGEKTGSQIIFTTHTPEIISDLKKNELHLIKSGEFEEIDKNNLGDTINSINKDLFEKEHTISTRAIEKINKYYDKFHKEFNIYNLINIKNEIIQELGDSAERFELLLEIEKKIKRKSKEGN